MSDQPTNADVAAAAAGISEPQVENNVPEGGNSGESINPAWSEMLGALPSSLHHVVTPHLKSWDEKFKQQVQQVQSQYDPYKPLLEQKVDPNEALAAMQLAKMIAENPRDFYDRMGTYYGAEWGLDQGQAPAENDEYSLDGLEEEEGQPQFDLAQNPLIQQLQTQQETIANFLAQDLQRKQAEEQARLEKQADEEVAQEFATVSQKYGEVPPQVANLIVSTAIQNNIKIVEAADQVYALLGNATKPTPPTVVSPSGGVPLTNIDPRQMNRQQTRKTVEQILAAAQSQG